MGMKVQKNKGETVVKVEGALSIEESPEIREGIFKALDRHSKDRLVLDLGFVEKADLAGLQVLCSAHKSAMDGGMVLELKDIPVSVRKAVEAAGYVRHVSCRPETDAACFWLGGNTTED